MNVKHVRESPMLALLLYAWTAPLAFAGKLKEKAGNAVRRIGRTYSCLSTAAMRRAGFQTDVAAQFNLGRGLSIVGIFIGAILVLLVVAALLPEVFPALGSVVQNITDGSTGNATADALLPVFGLIIALSIVIGIVTLLLNSTRFGGR
jgi:hypothetical protein